jgi:hypothetical protein
MNYTLAKEYLIFGPAILTLISLFLIILLIFLLYIQIILEKRSKKVQKYFFTTEIVCILAV